MSLAGCPGAERIRASFPDEVLCVCGEKVEMWPDEFEIRCPACGRTVERTVPPACIEWCAAARECAGERLYEQYMRARGKRSGESLKDKLLNAMRSYFGRDTRRIKHAERVTAFAEEILDKEKGHYGVVLAASILHDIGIPEAERKYGSSKANYQEREGPPIARKIMEKMGIDKKVIDETCAIIGHHHSPGKIESTNFKIVYDADRLVNTIEKLVMDGTGKVRGGLNRAFLTKSGREMASYLFMEKKAAR